jgi:hypothetical protein
MTDKAALACRALYRGRVAEELWKADRRALEAGPDVFRVLSKRG